MLASDGATATGDRCGARGRGTEAPDGKVVRADTGKDGRGSVARLARKLRGVKTLLEVPGQMTFNTHFTPLFRALGDYLERYLWLLTSVDCQGHSDEFPYRPGQALLLSGVALRRIAAGPSVDFDWGVFSGFPPGSDIDLDHLAVVPWADGNRAIWHPAGGPQYPGAAIEITFWDSTATIITSEDSDLHRRLRERFGDARPMPPSR